MNSSIACRKFKIVNIFLNKLKLNDNIVSIILIHYWNIVESKRKVLLP